MTIAPKRMQENFGRAAARYDAHAWLQQQQVQRMLEMALRLFPEEASILDIGCGTGEFARLAMPLREQWRITGLDYALPMARQAKPRCAHVLQAEAAHLPIADNALDAVVSSLCMQWVDDKPAMLAEIHRVLKPQGTALLISLGRNTLTELREAAAQSDMKLGLLEMLSFAEYQMLARASGMELLGSEQVRDMQYYPSVEALLHSMRAIGAGNAQATRSTGLSAPSKFVRMIQTYEVLHATDRGIPATWEPILLLLRKPA